MNLKHFTRVASLLQWNLFIFCLHSMDMNEEYNKFIELVSDKYSLPSSVNYRLTRNPNLYHALNGIKKNILMAAIEGSKLDLLDDLLNKLKSNNLKLNINDQDSDGNTALHYAIENYDAFIYYKKEYIFDTFFDFHPNISLGNKDGNTALHLAVKKSQINATKKLLDNNADQHQKNVNGESALDIAKEINNPQILTLLLEHKPEALPAEKKLPLSIKTPQPIEKNNLLKALSELTQKLHQIRSTL